MDFSNRIYKVKYDTQYGVIEDIVVLKHNSSNNTIDESIAQKLSINKNQIIAKNIELSKTSEIKFEDLSILLISLYSSALSGENLAQSLERIVASIYKKPKLNNKIKYLISTGATISDIFERLSIHPVVTSLIKSAEKTNNQAQAFDDANEFLKLEEETRKATKTGIGKSIFYMVLGVLLTFVTPVFLVDFINELLETFEKKPTFVINYLNVMANNVYIFAIALLIIALLITAFAKSNKTTKNIYTKLPIISNFEKLSSIKKAIAFIPFYSTLNSAGINDNDIVVVYRDIDANISNQLSQQIKQGVSLADSIKSSDMPTDLATHITTILRIENLQAKQKAFKGVIKLFTTKAIREGKKLSAIFSIVGYTLMSVGMLTMVIAYQTIIGAAL
jgi:type II secretory pathway component PulF